MVWVWLLTWLANVAEGVEEVVEPFIPTVPLQWIGGWDIGRTMATLLYPLGMEQWIPWAIGLITFEATSTVGLWLWRKLYK